MNSRITTLLLPVLAGLFASAAEAAPAVSTSAATGLTTSGATLHGSVISDRVLPYYLGFRYGVDEANLDLATSGGPFTGGAGSVTAVDLAVGSLACGTTYYFVAVATEPGDTTLASGTRDAPALSFRTLDCPGPSVTTFVADGVTATAAVLHGQVNPNGTSTNAFFDLGTAPGSLGVALSAGTLTGSTAQDISATPNALSCGTTYYYQARGTDAGNNTATGTVRNFTTSACASSAPVVTTQAASAPTPTSATLNATVNPKGLSTTAQFEYGSSPGALNLVIDKGTIGSGSADIALTGAASGLACGTTYYVRAKATNSVNTTIGATLSFDTSACPAGQPTAVTDSAVATQTSATFNGSVNPNGVSTDTFFDYGTSAGTLTSNVAAGNVGSGNAAQPISAGAAGLACGTTYFYRARGVNAMGTGLGATLSTQTGACAVTPPVATTGAASGITATAANLAGSVNPNGSATSAFFDYGQSSNTLNAVAAAGAVGSGSSAVAINASIASLACNTQYFYRARGTNAGGSGMGSTLNFTTAACPATAPSVTTDPPTSNGAGMPVLHATVTPNRADTQVFFDYSATQGLFDQTLAVGSIGSGSAPVAVTGTPSGLACGTTYFGRARGVNSAGTGLGAQVTFSTPACQCKVGFPLTCGSIDNWANNNPGSTTSITTYTCKTSGLTYSGETGPEFTYSFLQQTAQINDVQTTITMTPTSADLDLFVLNAPGGSCLGGNCTLGSFRAGTSVESISFLPKASTVYDVAVDGFSNNVSAYKIQVGCNVIGLFKDGTEDGAPNPGCQASEIENNDTPAGAALVPIPRRLCGQITPGTDVDYYRISLPNYADLHIETVDPATTDCKFVDFTQSVDTVVTLYASNGTTALTSNDDERPGYRCSQIDSASNAVATHLAPGTYYIGVRNFSTSQPSPVYQLLVRYNALCGNGVREGSETCDDGNHGGCSATCQ